MKKVLNNKKGFTLIELLAVIVILAILVMVAIPAVTKYLNSARQGTFADNAKSAISAVRNDVIMNGYGTKTYSLTEINNLLEKKLTTSPWGKAYASTSCIAVDTDATSGATTYSMCLVDDDGHGWTTAVSEDKIGCDGEGCIKAAIPVSANKTCSCTSS